MRRGFGTTLSDLLVEDGVITEYNVEKAEQIQRQRGGRLEHIFVEQGFVEADEVLNYSSRILETGPTGSGKTATLYASLDMVNGPEVNAVTIEDPVEHISGKYAQIEIAPKAGRTFASALRFILCQDPDIIMVGEVRDFETAELAIQAAIIKAMVGVTSVAEALRATAAV